MNAAVQGTIAAWLQRRAATPQAPAFVDARDGATLDWAEIALAARSWAKLAAQRGLSDTARVALVVEDPLSFVAAWFGVVANGLAVVPLDPRAPGPQLEQAMRRARVRVLATDREDLAVGAGAPTPVERWSLDRKQPQLVEPAGEPPWRTCRIALAALLMSSGTTGAPKGIPLGETQLVAAARRIAAHHRLTPRDRGYSPLPLFHVNAQVVGLLTTLASGSSLVLDRCFDAERYWDTVESLRPTWLNTVPAVIGALVRRPAPPAATTASVRFARSASSALPLDSLRRFEALTAIGVLETYGMTEAASQVTANPLDPAKRRPGSVGFPVGVELRVVADGPVPPAEAAAGELGTVQLRGAAVVEHYLVERAGREQMVPARDATGWLTTGDAGRVDEDGYVYLAGRTDDVINRGGEKFHPRDVEDLLARHPAVAAAAVVPEPHDRLGQVPVAFLRLEAAGGSGSSGAVIDELRQACEAGLSRFERPVRYEVVEALPTGSSGKVLRRLLREQLARNDAEADRGATALAR